MVYFEIIFFFGNSNPIVYYAFSSNLVYPILYMPEGSKYLKLIQNHSVYDDFSSDFSSDKPFLIGLVKFYIFENVFIIVKNIFYRLTAYLWAAHFLVFLLTYSCFITKLILLSIIILS